MKNDDEEVRIAIQHCGDVINQCQQNGLCKKSHEQLRKWLEELLEWRSAGRGRDAKSNGVNMKEEV